MKFQFVGPRTKGGGESTLHHHDHGHGVFVFIQSFSFAALGK